MLEKKISFEYDSIIENFQEYDDEKFAIAKVCILSTGPNAHGFNITDEILRRDAGTVRGQFLVGRMFGNDFMGHERDEIPIGYFPVEKEVEFEETEVNGVPVTKAWAYAVFSKMYANNAYEAFKAHNHRAVSIEMTCQFAEDDIEKENPISFDIFGVTVLGRYVNPSDKNAEINLIRFSEEANSFFNELQKHPTQLEQFSNQRKVQMEEKKSYKVDKSKESLSNADWSDVNKSDLRKKITEAKNASSLVNDVYLKVESGWQEAPSEKLGYPVMQIKGDSVVYNRNALASALAYARQHNETEVINKLNKIYKSLGLDDNGKEGEAKMEDKDKLKKLEEPEKLSDPKQEEDEKKEPEKMAEPAPEDKSDSEKDKNKDEDEKMSEPEEKKMSEDVAMCDIAKLQKDIEDKDTIIMEKDKELEELRAFKAGVEEEKRNMAVAATLEEIKPFVNSEQFESLKAEGMACKFSEIDGWTNKAKAVSFEASKGKKEKKSIWSFSAPIAPSQDEPKNVWERLKKNI